MTQDEPTEDELPMNTRRAIRLPRRVLEELRALEQGFRGDPKRAVYEAVVDTPETCDAASVGTDASCKHPYVFVVVTDGTRVLTFDRRGGDSSRRLRRPLTVGLRAPIDPEAGADPVLTAMHGVLESTIRFTRPPTISYRGVLNDELEPNARASLGLVFLVQVEPGSITLLEDRDPDGPESAAEASGAVDTPPGDWVRMERLRRMGSSLESWSDLLLPQLARWVDDGSLAA